MTDPVCNLRYVIYETVVNYCVFMYTVKRNL